MLPHFLIARFNVSLSHYWSTQIHLRSLLQRDALRFFSNSFTSHASSDRNSVKGDNFTMSYLIDSCGLSPDLATKLSNGVLVLKNLDGPNAVLDLLKNFGFSKTQIAKLVQKHPLVLAADAENTLLPKLEFFRSIGVSNTDMPKIVTSCCFMLRVSLKNYLIPRYEILRSVVRDDQEVVKALKRCPLSFSYCDIMNDLIPNIEVLRQCGVPQSSISLLITNFPGVAPVKHFKFVEAVKLVKEIGFEPKNTAFVVAIQVLLSKSKAVWESRFKVYEKWGWDRKVALEAFRKYPSFMNLSEKTITRKMSFLMKDMGLSATDITKCPQILGYNLEKRIIPRFSVIKILKSKGLVNNNLPICSFVCVTEEKFLVKFVFNFQPDLPLLLDVYKGSMDYQNVI